MLLASTVSCDLKGEDDGGKGERADHARAQEGGEQQGGGQVVGPLLERHLALHCIARDEGIKLV